MPSGTPKGDDGTITIRDNGGTGVDAVGSLVAIGVRCVLLGRVFVRQVEEDLVQHPGLMLREAPAFWPGHDVDRLRRTSCLAACSSAYAEHHRGQHPQSSRLPSVSPRAIAGPVARTRRAIITVRRPPSLMFHLECIARITLMLLSAVAAEHSSPPWPANRSRPTGQRLGASGERC